MVAGRGNPAHFTRRTLGSILPFSSTAKWAHPTPGFSRCAKTYARIIGPQFPRSTSQRVRSDFNEQAYDALMHLPVNINVGQYPRRMRWFMFALWIVIAVKCILVWWAMDHYRVPFHPLWIVAPTIVFAALASGLWLIHEPD
jgi:hypothetical protein